MRHGTLFPPPVSAPPSPLSLSHSNTNPWLRLSALCPHPSSLRTLLPLNKAVFPSPHTLPPSSWLCFSTWEPSPGVPTPSAHPSQAIPLLTCVLCVLFSSPVLSQEHCKAGSGSGSPNCAGRHNGKLHLIRCIGMCWGSYAKAPMRLCTGGECLLLLPLPSTSWLFQSLWNACTTAQKPLAWLGISQKDQSLGIAVSALELSWSVTVVWMYNAAWQLADDQNSFMLHLIGVFFNRIEENSGCY